MRGWEGWVREEGGEWTRKLEERAEEEVCRDGAPEYRDDIPYGTCCDLLRGK